MNVEEIRNLETNEIENQVKDLKQQLFTLRFQHATGQLENPNELKKIRTLPGAVPRNVRGYPLLAQAA